MQQIAGTPTEMAVRLRQQVREQVGLPLSVGVARTKFLAKVASGVAKPDGLLVVPPDGELEFLHPLAVEHLWGVGPVTGRALRRHGLETVGQIARLGEDELVSFVGRALGRHLLALAHNRDPRPVHVGRRRRSIGAQHALGRGYRSPSALDTLVVALVDRLSRRLRAGRRVCRTVVLRLRFDDYARATRSHTLHQATAQTQTILAVARALLAGAAPTIAERGLTLIGLALGTLEEDWAVQLALPFGEQRSQHAVDAVVDRLRDRFGARAITRAVLLGQRVEPAVPLLPD
jgi:DNA polymerase-4